MAFIKSFCGIIGGATNRPAAADYITYASNTDSLDTMLASGYFNELSNDIYKNDRIWVFNDTDWADCRVTSENGVTPVTITPINSSEGGGTYYAIVGGPFAQYTTVNDALSDNQEVLIIDGVTVDTGNILINSSNVVIHNYSQWTLTNSNMVINTADFNLEIYGYADAQIRVGNTSAGAIIQGSANRNILKMNNCYIVHTTETNGVTLSSGAGRVTTVNGLKWYEQEQTNGCGIHCQNEDDFYDNIEFIANQSETYDIANFYNARANNIKFTGSFSGDPAQPSLTTGEKGKLTNLCADISVPTTFVASLGGQTSGVSGNIAFSTNIVLEMQEFGLIDSIFGATVKTNDYVIVENMHGILVTNTTDSNCKINNVYTNGTFTLNGANAICSSLSCDGAFTHNATNSTVVGCKFGGNITLNSSASGILSACSFVGNILEGPGTQVNYAGGNNHANV